MNLIKPSSVLNNSRFIHSTKYKSYYFFNSSLLLQFLQKNGIFSITLITEFHRNSSSLLQFNRIASHRKYSPLLALPDLPNGTTVSCVLKPVEFQLQLLPWNNRFRRAEQKGYQEEHRPCSRGGWIN